MFVSKYVCKYVCVIVLERDGGGEKEREREEISSDVRCVVGVT